MFFLHTHTHTHKNKKALRVPSKGSDSNTGGSASVGSDSVESSELESKDESKKQKAHNYENMKEETTENNNKNKDKVNEKNNNEKEKEKEKSNDTEKVANMVEAKTQKDAKETNKNEIKMPNTVNGSAGGNSATMTTHDVTRENSVETLQSESKDASTKIEKAIEKEVQLIATTVDSNKEEKTEKDEKMTQKGIENKNKDNDKKKEQAHKTEEEKENVTEELNATQTDMAIAHPKEANQQNEAKTTKQQNQAELIPTTAVKASKQNKPQSINTFTQ